MDKFDGICCQCFEPILKGCGVQLREGGRRFHEGCISMNGYYVRVEKRAAARAAVKGGK